MRIANKLTIGIAIYLCKFRGNKFIDSIEKVCDLFHRKLNNVNFDLNSNGELRVLQILSQHDFRIFFDVGANKGDWSKLVISMFPERAITIHAFEIVPQTFNELMKFARDNKNIIAVNKGLSNKKETISINIGKNSVAATACKIHGMKFHADYYDKVVNCQTIKAKDYMKSNQIKKIDFVKIDVEGMDLKVIKGFEEQLRNIKVIQFEYWIFNISSHDLLIDFYNYLRKMGFVIGKIFPKYVNFFEYHFNMENFHGSNFVAVRENETKIIKALGDYS